jgi:endogenous inhibitor of DNA gyrase (YacG/DUF329 family)
MKKNSLDKMNIRNMTPFRVSGVLFLKGRCGMDNKKSVYCPRCGRKVAEYDGRSTIDIKVKCRKCNKLVVYSVETGETRQEKLPLRGSGSGMRLY